MDLAAAVGQDRHFCRRERQPAAAAVEPRSARAATSRRDRVVRRRLWSTFEAATCIAAARREEHSWLGSVGAAPAPLLVRNNSAKTPAATRADPTAVPRQGRPRVALANRPTNTPQTTAMTAATAVAACERWCQRECSWPACRITACGSSPALTMKY